MADASAPSRFRSVFVWMALFFVLAFGMRFVFGTESTFDEETQRYLFTGNDPYYHWRIVTHITETGQSLGFDHSINYPNGGYNPNPPFFSWTTAPIASVLESIGSSPDPVGLALNINVALWGALTIIPVFMIGRDLWGKKAGLWAAFFLAVSAPHIQRTVAGFADHDAPTMFWVCLSFAFMVKALMALKPREYAPRTGAEAGLVGALRSTFLSNQGAMRFAVLAGLSMAAAAITWKGYPYILAVAAVGMFLQLLNDQLRRRDSVAAFLVYIIPLVLVTFVPLLYYGAYPIFLKNTFYASLYVLVGALVAGLVLVPTRKLPTVLVVPGLVLTGILGLVLMLVVFPDVGRLVFSGLGYFNQSKLYTTIAEARRTELGYAAASFGFFAFLLVFWGLGRAIRRAWKGEMAATLVTAWAAVATFMAFAASRFLMNAAPIFDILIGGVMAWLVARLGLEDVRRRMRARSGQGASGAAGALTWRSVLGVLGITLFFVLPNVWLGVDAALPAEFEAKHRDAFSAHQFGAFGISTSDLTTGGWKESMTFLSHQDTGLDMDKRPAFIAWWDYGHWSTAIGFHPTVADPFQNHYAMAGRFLASESEQEAMGWMTILLVSADAAEHDGKLSPAVNKVLADTDATLPGIVDVRTADAQYDFLAARVNMTQDGIFPLYEAVGQATNRHIGYMGVDQRMYPYDYQNSGIFYAPAYLANKNPDDFLKTSFATSGGVTLTLERYDVDEQGNSYQLSAPRYMGSDGKEYEAYNGKFFLKGRTPQQGFDDATGVTPGSPQLEQLAPFKNSMFNRAFGGQLVAASVTKAGHAAPGASASGSGLSHWRTIQESSTSISERYNQQVTASLAKTDQVPTDDQLLGYAHQRTVALLEYYHGATVSGFVRDDANVPIDGITVAFVDGFGGIHDSAVTDAQGHYTITAPFSVNNDLNLTFFQQGVILHQENKVQPTRAEVSSGATILAGEAVIPRSNVEGIVFQDNNGDRQFDAKNDTALSGAVVNGAGTPATTAGNGHYELLDLQAGTYTLIVNKAGYQNASLAVAVGGIDQTKDIVLTPRPIAVSVNVTDTGAAGKGPHVAAKQVPVTFTAKTPVSATTNDSGVASTTLAPGHYDVKVDYEYTDAQSGLKVHLTGATTLDVVVGHAPYALSLEVQRAA